MFPNYGKCLQINMNVPNQCLFFAVMMLKRKILLLLLICGDPLGKMLNPF